MSACSGHGGTWSAWLVVVWRLPWYIPIVFPLELCNTDQVGVQETQVVAANRAR